MDTVSAGQAGEARITPVEVEVPDMFIESGLLKSLDSSLFKVLGLILFKVLGLIFPERCLNLEAHK